MINNRGFSEIIRMVIVISFISVIYMTGIYIWQQIEAEKKVSKVVEQLNDILALSQNREDGIEFDLNSQGGCGNIYLYSFDKERTNSLSFSVNVLEMNLLNNKKTYFDVGTDGIELYLYRGDFLGFLHCNNKLPNDLLEYEKLSAQSGQVGIILKNYNLVDEYIEDVDYQATVFLKDVVFVDENGEEIYISKYIFDDIDVGWLPE